LAFLPAWRPFGGWRAEMLGRPSAPSPARNGSGLRLGPLRFALIISACWAPWRGVGAAGPTLLATAEAGWGARRSWALL